MIQATLTFELTDETVMFFARHFPRMWRRRVPSMNNYWQRLYAASAG